MEKANTANTTSKTTAVSGYRPSHPPGMLGSMRVLVRDQDAPVLQGDALVARLRGDGDTRPPVDPGLAGGLREWLDDELAAAAATVPAQAVPVRLTKDLVNQVLTCEAHLDRRRAPPPPTPELVRGICVDLLFRQWVTIGRLGDPLDDALSALAASPDGATTTAAIAALDEAGRSELAAELAAHSRILTTGWPVPPPSWLARTQERLTVALAGGRVILQGVVDLALGSPSAGTASVCIVEVKSGRRRVEHRGDLQLYALMETLRSGAPPFRVATYYTATGELDVESVGREVLQGALHRLVLAATRLCRLASGGAPVPSPNPLCSWCAALPVCPPGRDRPQRQDAGVQPEDATSDDEEEQPWR